ncbi:hypothetical protein [Streptomyces sp. NPDC101132]|uniref:hypothetical protein n=1 Tax=Streptomyces sp. NPDC101132 TaxID=3366110 RepID=UPI00382AE393
MSSYRGPAILITDEGREFQVTANLQGMSAGLRTSWAGTLSVPNISQPAEMTNLPAGRIRIGEHEGAFIRPNIRDWLGSPPGTFQITIEGNGDAPF